jgi:ribulose-5-phosphate 4-epimerase/fuculose-1-phosphate aldolase
LTSSTAVDDLIAGCAVLDAFGLTSAFGHLSIRVGPERVLMSPSFGPGAVQDEEDLVSVTLSGESERGSATPGEAAIHLAILARRTDVKSVCRFHGPAGLAWSALGRPLPAVVGVGLSLGAEVPWFETASTITHRERADELANVLAGGPAVILRGFGAVSVGSTVREAVVRAWLLECSAAATLAATMAGAPMPYSAADAAPFVSPGERSDRQIERIWGYLVRRAADRLGPGAAVGCGRGREGRVEVA